MKKALLIVVTSGLVAASSSLLAIDIEHGKSLQQKNCMSCHDDGMYTREERRITTLDALRHQVQRCETNLNLQWFPEDVDAVIEYLNTTFYNVK